MVDRSNQTVSVIVPVYNRSSTVVKALQSVQASSYRPVELVVVDDGSTDNSLAVIKKYQSENQTETFSIIVINQDNGGAPKARNRGLRESTGRYVQFLDSDDFIDETKIKVQVDLMKNERSDICVCDFRVDYVPPDKESHISSNKNPRNKVVKGGSVSCCTCLMDRELAKAVKWTESLPNFQDTDYFLKVLILARRVSYIPKPLYFYQLRSDIETISSIRKSTKAKVPYGKRLKSLICDCIFNGKYGSFRNRFTLGPVALLFLLSRSFKSWFTANSQS